MGPLSRVLRRRNPRWKEGMREWERGKGDWGSLILFNRAITHFQFCLWIQMS